MNICIEEFYMLFPYFFTFILWHESMAMIMKGNEKTESIFQEITH